MLRRRFPDRHSSGRPHSDLPLFPDLLGKTASKKHFVKTIVQCAARSGQTLQNPDGTLRVTGHSLRATGAQMLARLGFGMLDIQLIGRWGSDALLTYVRGAAVGVAAARARAAQLSGSVRDLTSAAVAAGVPHGGAPDFEEIARKWFDSWLPAAAAQLRPTLVKEALEHLKRAHRPPSRSSSSSSSRSSSSSSSSSSVSGDNVVVEPAAVEPSASQVLAPAAVLAAPIGDVILRTVGNKKRKRNHLVVVGPPASPEQWVTHCSWKFGVSRSAVDPNSEFARCVRCARAGGPNWGGS